MSYGYTYDRSTTVKKASVGNRHKRCQGGSIVGEHDVIFAGTDEVVTFSHTAYSKAILQKGALEAAKFLAGKGPDFIPWLTWLNCEIFS